MSAEDIFVVYDPSEGFVTGGGWIISPEGAYRPDPTLTGKANFGFVSKYKKGANVPTGQTEFQFRAADFNYHSEEYQWLVVAGARAQFKGTGRVQVLEGDYGFVLTATDAQIQGGGDVDKFRINIWEVNPNDAEDEGAVIYDNQFTDDNNADPLALVTGNIAIHNNGQNLRIDEHAMSVGAGVELTSDELRPVVNEAIEVWEASGVDAIGLAQLRQLSVHVAQLSHGLLGVASESTNMVWIDRDVAGQGWSVNGTSGGVDLLSTMTHEFGHILGLDHDVMGATLAPGLRALATSRLSALDKARESLVDFAFGTPSFHDTDEDTLKDASDLRKEILASPPMACQVSKPPGPPHGFGGSIRTAIHPSGHLQKLKRDRWTRFRRLADWRGDVARARNAHQFNRITISDRWDR